MEYNEDEVLYYYVRNYLSDLLTGLEKQTDRAALARQKTQGSSPGMAQILLERWGKIDDDEVNELLVESYETFRKHVVTRLRNECPDKLLLNRCPHCNRIVRTPKAKQCLWCGNDWH